MINACVKFKTMHEYPSIGVFTLIKKENELYWEYQTWTQIIRQPNKTWAHVVTNKGLSIWTHEFQACCIYLIATKRHHPSHDLFQFKISDLTSGLTLEDLLEC